MLEPIPADVRNCSRVLVETDEWLVGVPLNMHAMWWWGAFAEWCVADDRGLFNEYSEAGSLIVFRSRTTSFKWLLQPVTGQFCDVRNRAASWRGFLMRHPELAGAILGALDGLDRPRTDLLAPLLDGLAAMSELARWAARSEPVVAMHLAEVEGSLLSAIDALRPTGPSKFEPA